jgi:hypothetical protein
MRTSNLTYIQYYLLRASFICQFNFLDEYILVQTVDVESVTPDNKTCNAVSQECERRLIVIDRLPGSKQKRQANYACFLYALIVPIRSNE